MHGFKFLPSSVDEPVGTYLARIRRVLAIEAEWNEQADRPLIGRFSKDPAIQQICRDVVSHLRLFGEVRWSLPRGDRRDLIFGDTDASSDRGMRVNFVSGSKASANHEDDDLP